MQQQSRSSGIQSGTSGLMTETASPEQPSNRSLRGVRHTFYTTQTNSPSVSQTRRKPHIVNSQSGSTSPLPRCEEETAAAQRLRCGAVVNVLRDLLLLLALTGGASVAPKHGLHDGATASTLIFRQFSAENRLFFLPRSTGMFRRTILSCQTYETDVIFRRSSLLALNRSV